MRNKLYFAYGSNLNREDWARWCNAKGGSPDVLKFHSTGYLPDHDICFSLHSPSRNGGVLDIAKRTGQLVPGVIFEVLGDGWELLDRKEGVPIYYERVKKFVLDDRGEEVAVETYQVKRDHRDEVEDEVEFVQPTPEYVDVVRAGLEAFGLPTKALDAASQDKLTPWLVDAFFVYGTLMRGESRFPALQAFGVECALLAQACGRLMDLGSFPGLVESGSQSSMVQGDFVRLREPDQAIDALDQIEGFQGFGSTDSLYRRTLSHVEVGEGRVRLAWVYALATDHEQAEIIPTGDWRMHRGSRDQFLSTLARIHAQGDEESVATKIAQQIPFAFNPDTDAVVQSLLPLQSALAQGVVSERKLAQESGIWTACV